MKIKKEALEKLINESIEELREGFHESETICIYEGDGVQVQVTVTKDESDYCDVVFPEYQQDAPSEVVETTIHHLDVLKPKVDSECLVWMGTWWRHVTWCEKYQQFLTGDMELLRKPVTLWIYAPAVEEADQ